MSTELLKAALFNFLADYWWLILMVLFASGYSAYMYKKAKGSRRAPTVKPRTAGAEYAFSIDELRPFFWILIGDEGSDRVRKTFGAKYDRLVDLKRTYDPTNMFRYNQNIAP